MRSAISQLVLKVHDLCNLQCDYCYVYDDASYVPARQKSLNLITLQARLDELVSLSNEGLIRVEPGLEVTLHGGEPTMVGLEAIASIVDCVERTLKPIAPDIRVSMTTNGLLFDHTWARYFADNPRLGLAISHDGDPTVHAKHRLNAAGKSSYAAATKAIQTAIASGLDPFVLAVIDPHSDPRQTLDSIFELGVRRMDLLLPETHGKAPVQPGALESYVVEAFTHWSSSRCGQIRVRLFDTVIARLLGRETKNCTLGPGCAGIVTVHADGDLSGCDVLGSKAAPGRISTADVEGWTQYLDRLSESAYGISQQGPIALSKPLPCVGCRYWNQCGGYCLATRIDHLGIVSEDRTTPHCGALFALFSTVERHLARVMPHLKLEPASKANQRSSISIAVVSA